MKIVFVMMMVVALALVGCDNDGRVASRNISTAALSFEIERRIVFYNGITGEYMLSVEGRCAMTGRPGHWLEVTCKVGENDYRKHVLGLSDNVTYFAEQLSEGYVSAYHHRIIFKPQVIVPDMDFRGSTDAMKNNASEAMQ